MLPPLKPIPIKDGHGGAAAIAGLSVSEIIDELGHRKIAIIRITPEELDEELKYFRTLLDRR